MPTNATTVVKPRAAGAGPLGAEELRRMHAWWCACNYLAGGMIYLRANPLLREPLTTEHVKHRLLGHWGASPALSFVWAHLNRDIVRDESSPISGSGENLDSTSAAKAKEISKAAIRDFVSPRGEDALALAEAMIDEAKAVTATEALDAKLIDFVVDNIDDLLESLDGFTVQMEDGPRTLNTDTENTEPLEMTFIEEFLLLLTDPNISFLLIAIGVQAVLIEISSPGGWVAGFIGVVCLTLAVYGIGVLPVNWFGIIFMVTAFVLFKWCLLH